MGKKLDKMLERRVDEALACPLLTQEQMYEYIDKLWDDLYNGVEGCTAIEFEGNKDKYQKLSHTKYALTGEAVIMLHRMNADNPKWIHSGKDTTLDAYAIIGKAGKPETNPKTRAFWKCFFEETHSCHISELESFYAVVIANDTCDYDKKCSPDKEYDASQDYVLITYFTNGELLHSVFREAREVDAVKSFISDMGVIINDKSSSTSSNDNKKDMPGAETFIKLLSEIAPEAIAASQHSSDNKGDAPPTSSNKVSRKKVLEGIAKKNDTPPRPSNGADEEGIALADTE